MDMRRVRACDYEASVYGKGLVDLVLVCIHDISPKITYETSLSVAKY